jgi:hypothetical protein
VVEEWDARCVAVEDRRFNSSRLISISVQKINEDENYT